MTINEETRRRVQAIRAETRQWLQKARVEREKEARGVHTLLRKSRADLKGDAQARLKAEAAETRKRRAAVAAIREDVRDTLSAADAKLDKESAALRRALAKERKQRKKETRQRKAEVRDLLTRLMRERSANTKNLKASLVGYTAALRSEDRARRTAAAKMSIRRRADLQTMFDELRARLDVDMWMLRAASEPTLRLQNPVSAVQLPVAQPPIAAQESVDVSEAAPRKKSSRKKSDELAGEVLPPPEPMPLEEGDAF